VIAAMLLLSFLLPYVSPKNFALLSVISLAVPLLIILNILFALFWLLKVKKQLLLSLFVLLIGYKYVGSLYKFSSSKNIQSEDNISLMSYNVRLFNVYNWIDKKDISSQIMDFIIAENPDVISFQEYHPSNDIDTSNYPYIFEKLEGNRMRHGQVIWSKYPIVNSGSIDFKATANNAIFADIVKGEDTIRIYNVHLQSSGINANVEMIVQHQQNSPHKILVCGDFNNTAYSYVYQLIKEDLQDTFVEAGNGFGRTFDFKYFPVRIDFILADEAFQINNFKNYDLKLSDHYPIFTKVSLK
jgi:endonuclease/exonuclease/phosphatase family metal-dependent hydrolase